MKKLFLPLCALALLTYSCEDNKDADNTDDAVSQESPEAIQSENPFEQNQPAATQPAVTQPQAQPANPGDGQVGLNPEHGQPGHRCDIPVGVPLDTPAPEQDMSNVTPIELPPANGGAQPQPGSKSIMDQSGGNQPATQPLNAPGGSGGTAAGLNPPHGQPGHDCSIAVGQPLKN
jgi:hypothetical protein